MAKKLLMILITVVLPLYALAFNDEGAVKVLKNSNGIVILKLDGKKVSAKLKPIVEYSTVDELYSTGKYKLVVNGGFFDMKNQNPVSYVVIDGITVESPYENELNKI